jgi:hypothetical protein
LAFFSQTAVFYSNNKTIPANLAALLFIRVLSVPEKCKKNLKKQLDVICGTTVALSCQAA